MQDAKTELIAALQDLPKGEAFCQLSPSEQSGLIRQLAYKLASAKSIEVDEDAREHPATENKAAKEIERLQAIIAKAINVAGDVSTPSELALRHVGFVQKAEAILADLGEALKYVPGVADGKAIPLRDRVASQVGYSAALAYLRITGERPTRTYDPVAGSISGEWPHFLSQVFETLGINASVEHIINKLRKDKDLRERWPK